MLKPVVRSVIRPVVSGVVNPDSGVAPWNPLKPLAGESVNFWAKGRNGLTMPDSVGGNDVSILTPVYRGSASIMTAGGGTLERLWNGNSYTLYFKLKQIADISTTNWILKMGNNSGVERGLAMLVAGGGWINEFADGAKKSETTMIANVNTTIKGAGWIEVFVEIDKDANRARATVYKQSDGSALGSAANTDISTWDFTDSNNAGNIILTGVNCLYADFKKFLGLKTIAQCRNNSYVTDIQIFYPTIFEGTDVSGNAHHLTRGTGGKARDYNYYSDISTYCLDYGYSLYRSTSLSSGTDGYQDIYVPNNPSGIVIDMTAVLKDVANLYTYAKIEDHAGSLTSHNFADSMLNIPVAQWDKSDTTIFADAVRSSIFYDAGNTDNWHPSEFNYLIFSENCKTGHQGHDFFKVTDSSINYNSTVRKYLTELFSFATSKIGNDLTRVLRYTGDQAALDSAITLYADASVNNHIVVGLNGEVGSTPIKIYYGDATISGMTLGVGLYNAINKTYSGTSIYTIRIFNPSGLLGLRFLGEGTIEAAPLNGNIAEFNKAANLTYLKLTNNAVSHWTGSINGLAVTLETLDTAVSLGPAAGMNQDGMNFITGNISKFVNLKVLYILGDNTISGDISGLTKLTNVYIAGYSSCYGSVEGMTDLIVFEAAQPTGPFSGSLTNLANFNFICVSADNTISGDVTAMTNMVYLSCSGNNTISGSISNLINLYFLGLSGPYVSANGSIALLDKLQIYYPIATYTKPLRTNVNPLLNVFQAGTVFSYTSAEVNQLLADFWANRDSPIVGSIGRSIILNHAGSGAPTGQGATDKAALQAYRSPNNNGACDLWTVETN